MAKLTNAQLVDQLIALRAHCDHLETKLTSLSAPPPAAAASQFPRYIRRDGRVFEKHTVHNGFSTTTRHVEVTP